MKRTLSLIICLVLIFSALPVFTITASAANYYLSGNFYYSVSNNEVTLQDCHQNESGSVTIPSTFKGYPVKYIANYAFEYCYYITSITIGDNVVSIGDRAFADCTGLKSVYIGKNVTSIGEKAFYNCTALTSLNINASNPNYTAVDDVLFNKDKTTLLQYVVGRPSTEYVIPSSVTAIADNAFYYCNTVKEVTIPNSVKTIGNNAFYYCNTLTSLAIPDSVTTIGNGAFYNCHQISSLTVGKSVTSIGASAFRHCASVTSLTLPNTVTSIGNSAFEYCSSLTSINIPNKITTLEYNIFAYCQALKSINIPDSVTTIENNAFQHCTSLKSITIPKNVTSVNGASFYECSALTDYYVDANNTTYTAVDGIIYSKDKTALLVYPAGRSTTVYTLPSGITTVGSYAFAYNPTIESVIIPDGVITIDEFAFGRCSSLKNITIPTSLTTIGDNAFSDSGLESVFFRGTKKEHDITIGSDFYGNFKGAIWYYGSCVGVAEHTYDNDKDATCSACGYVRDTSKICGKNAFWSFDESTGELNIIGWGDMYDYNSSSPAWYSKHRNNITSIVVDKGINNIGNYAFKDLTLLTKVTISSSVDTLGTQAFYGCTNLKTFTVSNDRTYSEDGLKVIGTSAFQNCGFTSFTVPDTVTEIGNRAFKQCPNLIGVYIKTPYFNEQHTTMGYEVFMDCPNFTYLSYRENITSLPALCFKNCTKIEEFVLEDYITSITATTFANCTGLKILQVLNPDCTLPTGSVPTGTTIFGYKGSTAEAYASKSGNTFIAIEDLSGTCGDNVTWEIDIIDKELTLKGTGKTYSYDNGNNKNPFVNYRAYIEYINIGSGITHLGNRLFRGLNHATDVSFGKDVATMGYEVFYADNKLNDVSLNEGLTMLGALCFYNCTSLERINIPSTLTNIQNRAFKGSGLTSIILPKTVKTMGYEVFMNCANLWDVEFSTGVSMLNPRTFENCTSLTSFNFTDNMCRIRSRAFYGCSSFHSIYFEDANNMWGSSNGSEAKIASNAFTGCSSSLTMYGEKGTHIEQYAARHGYKFQKW